MKVNFVLSEGSQCPLWRWSLSNETVNFVLNDVTIVIPTLNILLLHQWSSSTLMVTFVFRDGTPYPLIMLDFVSLVVKTCPSWRPARPLEG